jgi:crossover junction endodeoxyribonuclease RusA
VITVSFPQPCKPLTMNQRLHWAAKAKMTREWRVAAGFAAVATMFGQKRGRIRSLPLSVVQLVLPVRSVKIRRDPHNWYPTVKAVCDGLVDAGLWPDDTPEYLMTIEPAFKQGGDVDIRIWERGEWLAAML